MKRILIAVLATFAALSFNVFAEEMNMGGDSMQSINMNKSAKEVSGVKGEGIIKAIDEGKHMVTIAHTAIPSIHWPAMTMAFSATPDQLMELDDGDHVAFTFGKKAGTGKIESIEKMK